MSPFDFLSAAVKEEVNYIRSKELEALNKSFSERKKEGISAGPLRVEELHSSSDAVLFDLVASFPIVEQSFKTGGKIRVHNSNGHFDARIMDRSANRLHCIAVENELEGDEKDIEIDALADDVTLKCMELGMRLSTENDLLQQFLSASLQLPITRETEAPNLNHNQRKALSAILDTSNSVVSIQGPPGTGKTTLLVEAIQQLVKKGSNIIVSAPSNAAVDHICQLLIAAKLKVLRLGNEEKIHEAVLPYTVDGYFDQSVHANSLAQYKKDLQKLEQQQARFHRSYSAEAAQEKRQVRNSIKELRKLMRSTLQHHQNDLLASVNVIAGTPVGLFLKLPKSHQSDVVILDEAGQCLAPLAFLVSSFGKRFIQCGDPQQLPSTVLSPKAQNMGLGKSWIEIAYESNAHLLLNEQFRMGTNIVAPINEPFYSGELISVESDRSGEFRFIDMAGYGDGEQEEEDSLSTFNLGEVEAIEKIISQEDFSAENTIIIAPYSAQIERIKKALGSSWKVSTVDAVQGQEADNIIISLTRSNTNGEIGFLSELRRTNVAISRAKNRCWIIGDSATMSSNKFYRELIENAEKNANYTSIWEWS